MPACRQAFTGMTKGADAHAGMTESVSTFIGTMWRWRELHPRLILPIKTVYTYSLFIYLQVHKQTTEWPARLVNYLASSDQFEVVLRACYHPTTTPLSKVRLDAS